MQIFVCAKQPYKRQKLRCGGSYVKKALIITTISGFVPQFEINNVRILQEMGYEVHYASNFEHPVYDFDTRLFADMGIITHHFPIEKSPFHGIRNTAAFFCLKKLLQTEEFDLIHCHNPMGGVLGRLAGWLYAPGAVMIYTAHGFHFYRKAPLKNWLMYYPVERLLAHKTDIIVTINREDFERASHFLLKKNGKVWQIPGVGLDVRRFHPEPGTRTEEKKKLGFPENSFLLLSVGELNSNKNHQAVILALAQLRDKAVFYGICGRGKGRKKLEKLIVKEGLQDHVKLLGYRKDVESVLHGADCFIFPSRREGFGMAAVEAMASGIPLITSDCRGTREYMMHGKTGLVCRDNSPDAYATAIEKMKTNASVRNTMGRVCRKQALQFSKEESARVMRLVYESVQDR